jgi:DNA mismatch repair protein MutS2
MASPHYFTDIQTLRELQFPDIQEQLASLAHSESAKGLARKLKPSNHKINIEFQLIQTHQRLSIIQQRRTVPGIEFDELAKEIALLKMEDAVLNLEGVLRIYFASDLVNQWLRFFEEANSYQQLSQVFDRCYFSEDIKNHISSVVDVKVTKNVKDDATKALLDIRSSIKTVRQKINRNFEREMRKLLKEGWLGDTHETFIGERRVLAVQSGYKRRVLGAVVGASKTGSLTYIEPQVNRELNHELDCLMDDERKEIYRILRSLSYHLRGYLSLIQSYQEALVFFDFVTAKARLAAAMEASLPSISTTTLFAWSHAFHPMLVTTNQRLEKPTIPQSFSLNSDQRILVISGPNAGGKSLTLKTFGLLQCMLQSGLLIPVHQDSIACVFQHLFSDIGDNQSIENELSTYSYRLKRMKYFLEVSNPKTVLLLDEFGSGSDPELGAALAEVFFEEIYHKHCFAMITTHYSSIKVKASELSCAVNGAMKFDVKSLKPLYELVLGLPGSSFTFEVAAINGIPKPMITEAKKKLSSDTKRLNQLLSSIQEEKQYYQKMVQEYKNAQERMQQEFSRLKQLEHDNRTKAKQLSQQAEEQAKVVQLGQKFEKYANRYQPSRKKQKENEALFEEIRSFIVKTRTLKPATKTKKPPVRVIEKTSISYKIGDKVKIQGSKQLGIIQAIEKQKITVLVNSLKMTLSNDKILPFP